MMHYAVRYRFLLTMMSKKETTIRGSDGRDIRLKTHNKSLYSAPEALWGKTGYTQEARRTFVGVDPSTRPRIIVSLLKSDALWDDIATLKKEGLALYNEKHGNVFSRALRWITGHWRVEREAAAY
jgi:D-alanyl-D-alanine carboxypeptidase